jgi:hypothetical protein
MSGFGTKRTSRDVRYLSAFGIKRTRCAHFELLFCCLYRGTAHEARCGAQKPHSFLIDEQLGLKTQKGLIFAVA